MRLFAAQIDGQEVSAATVLPPRMPIRPMRRSPLLQRRGPPPRWGRPSPPPRYRPRRCIVRLKENVILYQQACVNCTGYDLLCLIDVIWLLKSCCLNQMLKNYLLLSLYKMIRAILYVLKKCINYADVITVHPCAAALLAAAHEAAPVHAAGGGPGAVPVPHDELLSDTW